MNPDANPAGGLAPATVITSRRTFAAPRDRVIAAFTDPAQLARWWGPKGFRNTFEEFDVRPGGRWRFVMHGPDGTDYALLKEFVEVALPERIVLQQHGPGHRFRMTMTYAAPTPETTTLTWRMAFEEPEPPAVQEFIVQANEENFDRLAAWLEGAAGE